MTQILIAVGTTARNYVFLGVVAIVGIVFALRFWLRTDRGQ